MNYITEINQFNLWLESHYLTTNAQLLWYKLMNLFNKCGWVDWVQVDNYRLMSFIQVRSEDTAIRARDELVSSGLIEYQKGKKKSPNKYRMISFQASDEVENTSNNRVYPRANNGVYPRVIAGVNTSVINKHKPNQTETNNKEYIVQIVDYLNKELGTKFKSTTEGTKKHINARLNEGYSVEDFKKVIDTKKEQWIDDKKMKTYLRPSTLFGPKFENYLNESISNYSKSEDGGFNIGTTL